MLYNVLYDIVIIGGGINGAGIAADAALSGLSVLLCEADDLASHTSSNSSKLIHGGLRYLESYAFSFVKKARDEQQVLLNIAPHLIHKLPFVLPHSQDHRSLLQLRTGLFLYDHISYKNQLPHSKFITRNKNPIYFNPLNNKLNNGFLFYDCATKDARLTEVNALQAKNHGAHILTHTKLIHAEAQNNQDNNNKYWKLTFKTQNKANFNINTKSVINASGPWVESVANILGTKLTHHIAPIKGSHILMPKIYEGDHAYVLQHTDKRLIFVIPYQNQQLIGTTESHYDGDLNHITIDDSEVNYLCDIVSHSFKKPINPIDRLDYWSGVRPLLYQKNQSNTQLSRDYALGFSIDPAPNLTIYGGKLTTYRKLSSDAVQALKPIFPNLKKSKTHCTPLPGAELNKMNFQDYVIYAHKKHTNIDKNILTNLIKIYGTLTEDILAKLAKLAKSKNIYSMQEIKQAELDYLNQKEWGFVNRHHD